MSQPDYNAIQRVVNDVRLVDVRLVGAHADLNVPVSAIPGGWGSNAYVGFGGHVEEFDSNDDRFVGRVLFVAGFKSSWDAPAGEAPEYDPDDPPEVDLSVEFDLEYGLRSAAVVDKGDLEAFVEVNGVFHAWPYWRELAHNLTLRMGIDPLIVGVFRAPAEAQPASD